ncbi:MAG: DUF3782 domain-containing protein [Thermodesulfovibrionales bacterium]|nr:DUF3782 domain-containing protein [Thermodesulfovibrionales bacterium]
MSKLYVLKLDDTNKNNQGGYIIEMGTMTAKKDINKSVASRKKRLVITKRELREIVKKRLPELVKEEPNLKMKLAELVHDEFADRSETKDEIKCLIDELRAMRLESEKKWQEHREEENKKWEEQNKKWYEQNKKLEEQNRKWDEQNKRWEEQNKKWYEQNKKLEEQNRKWDEQNKRWEEYNKKWEEHNRKWEENQKVINENTQAIKKILNELKDMRKKHDSSIGALGARWGIRSETTFRNALKGMLEETFPVKVQRFVATDIKGEVFEGLKGQLVELDIIIRDGEVILAELKSSISKADVWLFEKKVRFFEKLSERAVTKKVIISPMIEPKAEGLIKDLGIKAYTWVPDKEVGL